MNPSGYRMEEKKETDAYLQQQNGAINMDEKSTHSYKSTHSSRSSVLERAREYNRRIDQQNNNRRAKSLERSSNAASDYSRSEAGEGGAGGGGLGDNNDGGYRSRSLGRSPQSSNNGGSHGTFLTGNTVSTHERAMMSVRKDSAKLQQQQQQPPAISPKAKQPQQQPPATTPTTPAMARRLKTNHLLQQKSASAAEVAPLTPASTSISRNTGASRMSTNQRSTATPNNTPRQRMNNTSNTTTTPGNRTTTAGGGPPSTRPSANGKGPPGMHMKPQSRQSKLQASTPQEPPIEGGDPEGEEGQNHNAVVTPELLVDALSGHEDGLLAIAEKLMEHYDSGYDVMGEAIIDAFADVQKLFQHVVEAAHMEGAAFEASRRESEVTEMRKQQQDVTAVPSVPDNDANNNNVNNNNNPNTPGGRHDEFVDQDVKDVLTEAIGKGTSLRDSNAHQECYRMYEQACQSASALLPVDSDHRGRLQLSIARAESMGPDRACAILRYAMDDVLRSGIRAGRTPLPDPSKRADVVLTRPTPSAGGSTTSTSIPSSGSNNFYKVAQSPDEALASLMEEMKEIMNAPVYDDTPLQSVAIRFWAALMESQKSQQKNEERLEQALGKLKGDFLLARAEWEEKLNKSTEKAELYKEKYDKLKDRSLHHQQHHGHSNSTRKLQNPSGSDLRSSSSSMNVEDVMDKARSKYRTGGVDESGRRKLGSSSHRSGVGSSVAASRSGSVASLGSGIAIHAKKLVNSIHDFNCNSEQAGTLQVEDEIQQLRSSGSGGSQQHRYRSGGGGGGIGMGTPHSSRSISSANSRVITATRSTTSTNTPNNHNATATSSRSFREYSKSPKRMDV